MSLERKRRVDIPEDAIILSEPEAMRYQLDILRNWKNSWDTFAFNYGASALALGNVVTCLYLNNHFRRKLKLRHYGRIVSYAPICLMPSVLSVFLHSQLVLKNLVLMKGDDCPICLELRSSAIQVFTGVILPSCLAPAGSLSLAHRYGTYNMPYITYQPKEVLRVLQTFFRPIKSVLFGMVLGHALLGSIVTYLEANSIITVRTKLAKIEQNIELGSKTNL